MARELITIAEGRRRVLGAFPPALAPETLTLREAEGRVLAEDVRATGDVPPFPNSAMDGFAVRAEDEPGAPDGLEIVDESRAGTPARDAVAPGTAVRVDTDGRAVFGEGEASVFALLDRIAEQARTADPLLSDSVGELDTHVATITTALSGVGARYARVDAARQSADDRNLALTTSLSEVESIDLPAAIVALQSQDVAYRAALGATAKVLQPSLLDFLR